MEPPCKSASATVTNFSELFEPEYVLKVGSSFLDTNLKVIFFSAVVSEGALKNASLEDTKRTNVYLEISSPAVVILTLRQDSTP